MVPWLVAVLAGCENDGDANVAGCNAFLDQLKCGEEDWSALYDDGFCDAYRDSACDMSPFWGCLQDQTVCDEADGSFEVDPDGVCAESADCLP
jgi:hypothetical protein